MFPLFLDGDTLFFVRSGSYQRGDIIVYREPGGDRYIIHRITRVTEPQVQTAGDNNSASDSYSLQSGDIIGKVTTISRVGERIRVRNGLSGYLIYCYRTRYQSYIHRMIRIFCPLYRAASHPPIFRSLCTRWVKYRPLVLIRPDGAVIIRMYLNTWYAAWIHEREGIWHIRTPYRLLIDESNLPDLHLTVREALQARSEELKEG